MSRDRGDANDLPPLSDTGFGAYEQPDDAAGEQGAAPDDAWLMKTQELPPSKQPGALGVTPGPLAGVARRDTDGRRRVVWWVAAVSALLIVAVVSAGIAVARRGGAAHTSGSSGPVCAVNTPCKVTTAYLAAYSARDFEQMYGYTSEASHTRFSDAGILRHNYTDAHDYIVNRTAGILLATDITSVSATVGQTTMGGASAATVTARVVLRSARVGDVAQDMVIPLVKEHGVWRVNWSPGLIFSKLDDANDPQYRRVVRLYTQDARRGTIYDRDGNVLAKDDTVSTVNVVPAQISNEGALLATLSAKLDMTPEQIKGKYAGVQNTALPVAIRTITPQLYAQISGALNATPGVVVTQGLGRVYPYGADAAAVTGYAQPVSGDDVKNDPDHYYACAGASSCDVIGRAGVEQWGEKLLRPVKGGRMEIIELNADGTDGQAVYALGERPAVNGDDIHTAVALAEQQAAMAQLRSYAPHAGGSFAVDPASGEVRVMASYPIYDPNDFTLGFTPNELARFNVLDHPYLNRAVGSAYPTGSIFKIVTLAAALANGITPSQIFTCTGTYQVPGESHLRIDDKPGGHGVITAPDALAPSCDVVFWQLAVTLNQKDPNLLPSVAKSFGYGAATGVVGLAQGAETAGILPDPAYLQQQQNAQWSPTDAANLGIGQGFFQATAAQVTMVSAAVAEGGKRMQPRLVTTVVAASGATVQTYAPTQVGTAPLTSDTAAVLQAAMVATTLPPSGTSQDTFMNFPFNVAGKTGTAESGNGNAPHSWFTAFAPAAKLSGPPQTPQICDTTVVEYSSFGDAYAAPVVRAVLKAYFKLP